MKRFFPIAVALAGVAIGPNAFALTQTATVGASATVSTVCSMTATTMPFSEVALSAVTNGQATVAVTCTNGGPYTVALDNGMNVVGAQRNLKSGVNTLAYGLFSDAAFQVPWGSTLGSDTVAGTGNGAEQDLIVYGQITAGQTLTTGSYADTVTVTVTY